MSDKASTTKESHGIVEWFSNLGKFIVSGVAANCTIDGCAYCQKSPVRIKCSGLLFCSPKCHDLYLPKHQHLDQYELGKRKCRLLGCKKLCYVENRGKVHDFCSRSHAEEYQKECQKQQWELKQQWEFKQQQQQQQQYLLLQCQHRKHQQQKPPHEKICQFPGCEKSCYSDRGQTHDFCSKSHADLYNADMYKPHHNQAKQKGNHQPRRSLAGSIYFYNRDEEYYEFTNFAPYHVMIDNKVWPTTEHYFQAQKFVGTPYEEAIRKLSFPRDAFDFSRKPAVSCWRRSDWEQVKEDVMHKALLAKFTQHDSLFNLLLGTDDSVLVEHTRNDSYWGDGGDGTGKNRLGNLLMEVRQTLRRPKVISLSLPRQSKATHEKKQSNPSPHQDDEDESMDTDDLNSPTEPLVITNPHTADDIQNCSHGQSAVSPTASPTAVNPQGIGGTSESAVNQPPGMTASQATNAPHGDMMSGNTTV